MTILERRTGVFNFGTFSLNSSPSSCVVRFFSILFACRGPVNGSRLRAGMTAREGQNLANHLGRHPRQAQRDRGSIRLQRGGKVQSLVVMHCTLRPVPSVARWIGSRLKAGMTTGGGADPCQTPRASSPTSGARSGIHSFAERREGAVPCSGALRLATSVVFVEVDWIPARGRDDRRGGGPLPIAPGVIPDKRSAIGDPFVCREAGRRRALQ